MTVASIEPRILLLDGSGVSIGDVGGKAAGLDRLAGHGLPIPHSYAITAGVYRQVISTAGLEPWLKELAARPAPEPRRLGEEIEDIERAFRSIMLDRDLRRAIEEVADELLARGLVAVRSSATAEDLGVASFAGQYQTSTRVRDLPGVIDAVKRCWASLWLPAAREYRIRHRIPSEGLAMAVVIQSMVDADWSGVGFTVDPASDRPTMRVELVPGIGEDLVSGRVTPIDLRIRRDTLEITGSAPGSYPLRCVEDVARMMLRVEDRLDEPQDIEWASAADEIILLQARPLTVVGPRSRFDDGFDAPIHSEDDFTPHGVVEMLPDVVSPLLWTINAPMIEHGYRSVVADMGGDPGSRQRPFIGRFRGRAALNLSALREIAASLPGGSAADVERQFLGTAATEDESHRRAGIRSVLRARQAQRKLNDDVDLAVTAADAIVALEVDLASLPAWRLVGYRRAIRDLAWRISAAEVSASSAATASYRALEVLLSRWLDEAEAATWAQRLTAGTLGRHAAGARLDRELGDAYGAARVADGAVAAAVAADSGDIAQRLHELGATGAQLHSAVIAAARQAGSRAVYGGPTWEEAPELVWRRLRMLATHPALEGPRRDRTEALEDLAKELRSRRSWKVVRVVTGQVVDLRLRWIDQLSQTAARTLRLRERAKSALLTLGGEEHRTIGEIASRLVESHQIAGTDEVWTLTDRELTGMLLGAPPPPKADLHWRRSAARRAREARALPEVFAGSPGIAAESAAPGRLLTGWSASPGKATGPARVISDLADAARLRRGDVLVATATDPSWTSVIVDVAAIVLETGGPLSHAAIVAREFGIPAVLKVRDATRLIADGESIAVDGQQGSVLRVDEPESVV
jgi:pyruvate,water dikinase